MPVSWNELVRLLHTRASLPSSDQGCKNFLIPNLDGPVYECFAYRTTCITNRLNHWYILFQEAC